MKWAANQIVQPEEVRALTTASGCHRRAVTSRGQVHVQTITPGAVRSLKPCVGPRRKAAAKPNRDKVAYLFQRAEAGAFARFLLQVILLHSVAFPEIQQSLFDDFQTAYRATAGQQVLVTSR